jgi:hypothetical protein
MDEYYVGACVDWAVPVTLPDDSTPDLAEFDHIEFRFSRKGRAMHTVPPDSTVGNIAYLHTGTTFLSRAGAWELQVWCYQGDHGVASTTYEFTVVAGVPLQGDITVTPAPPTLADSILAYVDAQVATIAAGPQGEQGEQGDVGPQGVNVTITATTIQATYDAATPGATELVVLYPA